MSEVQRLVDEGNALLAEIDRVVAEQEKKRTWGSMALSSFRSDNFHHAMEKFDQAAKLRKAEEEGTL